MQRGGAECLAVEEHRQKADRTTSCLNEHLAGKRGENRVAKHAEDLETGQTALLQQRAHFEEEKLRLETLKAQLAAEPAVPKADDKDTDLETAGIMAEKELVLRRMAPCKSRRRWHLPLSTASAQKSRNKQTASQQC